MLHSWVPAPLGSDVLMVQVVMAVEMHLHLPYAGEPGA